MRIVIAVKICILQISICNFQFSLPTLKHLVEANLVSPHTK